MKSKDIQLTEEEFETAVETAGEVLELLQKKTKNLSEGAIALSFAMKFFEEKGIYVSRPHDGKGKN